MNPRVTLPKGSKPEAEGGRGTPGNPDRLFRALSRAGTPVELNDPNPLGDGCSLSDLIAAVLGTAPSLSDVVGLLVSLKGDGNISGRDLGALLRIINST